MLTVQMRQRQDTVYIALFKYDRPITVVRAEGGTITDAEERVIKAIEREFGGPSAQDG